MITDIPCVILSGGKSSRMGEDKSLLPFGKFDTMIEYQYQKLSKIFKHTYISSKDDKFDFLNNNDKVKKDILIIDQDKNLFSPIIALKSIFEKFKDKKVFIISVDTPMLHIDTIEKLIKSSYKYEITIAKDEERVHNLCGVFSSSLLNSIESMLEKDIHKVNYLIKNTHSSYIIEFNEKEQFININEKNTYNEVFSIS